MKKKKKIPKYQVGSGDTTKPYDPVMNPIGVGAPITYPVNYNGTPSSNYNYGASTNFSANEGVQQQSQTTNPYVLKGKSKTTQGSPLGYSGFFNTLNPLLDATQAIAGTVNDYKQDKQGREKVERSRYNTDKYNPYEQGLNNIPEYYQVGGGQETQQPSAQYQVDNEGRTAWNNYVEWLQKKGMAGKPELDKNDLGKQLLNQYMTEVPNSGLTKDNVVPIQKDFQNYRTWAINKGIPSGAIAFDTANGANPQNFMQNLSKIDGYPGSNTTLHQFPDAYLKSYNNGKLLSNTNLGYAKSDQHFKNGGLELMYQHGGGVDNLGRPLKLADFLDKSGIDKNNKNYKLLSKLDPTLSTFDDDSNTVLTKLTKASNKGDLKASNAGLLLQEYINYANSGDFETGSANIVNNTGYLPQYNTSNNPYNIIPSNNLTMDGVPHDVMAYPNVGQPVLMKQNGGKYIFPNADYVTEIPMYQQGGNPEQDQKQQLMQVFQAYAQMNNMTIDQLVKKIKKLPKNKQEAFVKQIISTVQQATAQQGQQQPQQQPQMQDGGQDQQQGGDVQQIIQAYAQLTNTSVDDIMKKLQSLPADQQQQAIQQMAQAIQQAQQGGQDQQQDPTQQQQQPPQMQQGGTPQVGSVPNGQATSELEKGEVFQDPSGSIKKVAESEPTHEDGGSKQNFVFRVLEDTADKRKDKDSKTLRISPEEAEQMVGFKPKGNTTHSKLYELATEYYDNKLKKVQKDIDTNLDYVKYNNGGKYAQNSLDENLKLMQGLPTKGQLFDTIYGHQENVKQKYNISQDPNTEMQNGGKIPKYQNGTYPIDPTNIDPQTYDPSKYNGLSYDALVNNWEKSQNYTSNGISTHSPSGGGKYYSVYNDNFLKLKPLIPAYYRNNPDKQYRPDLQLQQGDKFGNLNDYNLPEFVEANPWAKQFIGNGSKLTPENIKAMQSYYNTYMTNNYNTPYFTGNTAGIDSKFGEETAGLAPVYKNTINYTDDKDLKDKTKDLIYDPVNKVYLDKKEPVYYDVAPLGKNAPEPVKAGAPPINTKYTTPNGVTASSANEPLHWFDIAGDVNHYLSASSREPVPFEQLQRPPLKVHELDPLPTLLKNQGDFNAALQTLPQSGVGYANTANLLGNKYKINNEVLGQYENANKEKLDRVDEINNNNQYQLDQTNLGLRDQFQTRVLQSKEVQRKDKLQALDDLFTKYAQNNALNRNENLLLKMTPYFDQNGNFNGNQYVLKNNASGQDIIDKKTGKVVDTIGADGKLKSEKVSYTR